MQTELKLNYGLGRRSGVLVGALTAKRCMKFFIGWMKRFGYALTLFTFPLNKDEYLNL
jgi:hypothetical protein